MPSYCPLKECILPARIEVYRTTSSEAHQAHLKLMCTRLKEVHANAKKYQFTRSPPFLHPKSFPGALEILWKFGGDRRSRTRVLSEHTDIHTYTHRALYTPCLKKPEPCDFWHNFAKTNRLWINLWYRSRSYYLLVLSKRFGIGRGPPAWLLWQP